MKHQPTPGTPIRSTAEFARHVGLSRSTVSRILNGHSGLKPANIRRVQAAMEATGFTPNAHALHLRGKATGMIGVCMESLLTPTSVSKVHSLQKLLRERGLVEVIQVVGPDINLKRMIQHLLSLRVEAIIFVGYFDPKQVEPRLAELRKSGTPYVMIDNPGISGANTVTLDRIRAMDVVVGHLYDLGHRQFGLLGVSGSYQTITDRLVGLRAAVEARGLNPDSCLRSLDHLYNRTDHFEFGSLLACGFLSLESRPTAYIAVNDETAVGALLEFQAQGVRIPQDVSIVGFNNLGICLMTRPRLASVDQEVEKSAAEAVAVIEHLLPGRSPSEGITRMIDPLFIPRESTGPAPRA